MLKSLGATHVIDRNAKDIAAHIKKLLPGDAADFVYDSIGIEETHKLALGISSPKALILVTNEMEEGVNIGDRTVIMPFAIVQHDFNRKLGAEFYKVLPQLLEKGVFKVS